MEIREYKTEPLQSLREHVVYLQSIVDEDPDLQPDLAEAETALALRES